MTKEDITDPFFSAGLNFTKGPSLRGLVIMYCTVLSLGLATLSHFRFWNQVLYQTAFYTLLRTQCMIEFLRSCFAK